MYSELHYSHNHIYLKMSEQNLEKQLGKKRKKKKKNTVEWLRHN